MSSLIPSTRRTLATTRGESQFPVQDIPNRKEASQFCESLAALIHPAFIEYDRDDLLIRFNMHDDQRLSLCRDLEELYSKSRIIKQGHHHIDAEVHVIEDLDGPADLDHFALRFPNDGSWSILLGASREDVGEDESLFTYKGKEIRIRELDPTEGTYSHDDDGVVILADGEEPKPNMSNCTQISIAGYD